MSDVRNQTIVLWRDCEARKVELQRASKYDFFRRSSFLTSMKIASNAFYQSEMDKERCCVLELPEVTIDNECIHEEKGIC